MILYIIVILVFSFGFFLYFFWYMDDFNWGNICVVVGEKGKKVVIIDEGKFDFSLIFYKKWEEYQVEFWEIQIFKDDIYFEVFGYSYGIKVFVVYFEYVYFSSCFGLIIGMIFFFDFCNVFCMFFVVLEMGGGMQNCMSMYGGLQFFLQEDMVGFFSDDVFFVEICEIFCIVDLMMVIKKVIKQELECCFGVLFDVKKVYINSGMYILIEDIIYDIFD